MPARPRFSLPVVATGPSPDGPGCRPADPHANEFARGASAWDSAFSRRDFIARSAAAMALAGVVGCSDHPDEAIVPYVDPPEQVVPGEPQFFATTLTRDGYGRGVIVTSREGRPIKIEGNPDHPASLGAADAITQAEILSLYDPLRSASVTLAGVAGTWGAFVKALVQQMATHDRDGGEGLYLVTGPLTAPTLASLCLDLRTKYPKVRFISQAATDGLTSAVARADAGRSVPIRLAYDLRPAEVVVSFDSDFLWDEPGSLAYARQFADGRRVSGPGSTMNRLYVAESDFSITGSRADHRLAAKPSRVGVLLAALATQLEVGTAATPGDLSTREADWLSAVATDLHAHRGRSLVVVGKHQPVEVRELGLVINHALGNVGRSVRTMDDSVSALTGTLTRLHQDFSGGRVRTLLVLDGNPVRVAPGDVALGDAIAGLSRATAADGRPAAFTAHLGLYADETAYACQWHLPRQHELESWGDARAFDGTESLVQPLVAPPTQAKGAIDVLNVLLGQTERSAHDTVRDHWRGDTSRQDRGGEAWWNRSLQRGVIDGPRTAVEEAIDVGREVRPVPLAWRGVEVVLRTDHAVLDGRHFHNPWLQELPRPMTKIVWGNAAIMSPATAARHGVGDDAVVRLEAGGRGVEAPVVTLPGVADDAVVLHLGYGKHRVVAGDTQAMSPNEAYGVDAYPLSTAASPGFTVGVTMTATGRTQKVVRTHSHHAMAAEASADPSVKDRLAPNVVVTPDTPDEERELHNRKLIRTATLAQFAKAPDFAAKMDGDDVKQLYPGWDYSTGPQWGMTIDLTTCIGCNACVTACQAENNTPSVGPEQVAAQREMHWLRVDTYVDDDARVHHQPVPCMHCENAPCEYVCPVAATTHSVEGLNQMTYNRCVGTRYCSNNCPYKVRRFNFFNYTFYQPEPYKMQRNPDVTVRTRGVMEKCTYCVQRINYADRKVEVAVLNASTGNDVDTGGIRREMFARLQTACQQTCPTQAIHFGDITNPDAPVTKDKKGPRNYGILVELTTKPRTTYLASVTNPNPSLAGPTPAGPSPAGTT